MIEQNIIKTRLYESPCGRLILGSLGDCLCLCDWLVERRRDLVDRRLARLLDASFVEGSTDVIEKACAQLDEYFAGERQVFDIPLMLAGTDFQKSVWNGLLDIPYGATISYGALAQHIGMPRAVRAVANANRANALSIIVPCHRVIGSDHSMTGYAGGLAAKRALLALERYALTTLPDNNSLLQNNS